MVVLTWPLRLARLQRRTPMLALPLLLLNVLAQVHGEGDMR